MNGASSISSLALLATFGLPSTFVQLLSIWARCETFFYHYCYYWPVWVNCGIQIPFLFLLASAVLLEHDRRLHHRSEFFLRSSAKVLRYFHHVLRKKNATESTEYHKINCIVNVYCRFVQEKWKIGPCFCFFLAARIIRNNNQESQESEPRVASMNLWESLFGGGLTFFANIERMLPDSPFNRVNLRTFGAVLYSPFQLQFLCVNP